MHPIQDKNIVEIVLKTACDKPKIRKYKIKIKS